ncbi:hypothetical protein [Streptomyces longisporus]|uniref:Uncharacterized protein n=1 Tax=Streptomyces longisporus TaxID=1948 RepID=A0ABP5XYI4_STRLO
MRLGAATARVGFLGALKRLLGLAGTGAAGRVLGLAEVLETAERKPGPVAAPGPVGVLLARVVRASAADVMPDPVEAEGLGG